MARRATITSPQRPMLLGGERLREPVERSLRMMDKFHPVSVEVARAALTEPVRGVRESLIAIPSEQRGERVAFQMTLRPNYLAASYFPQRLLEAADLAVIGSRPVTAPYVTRTETSERLTKSLIVAGTDSSLRRLDQLVGEGQGHDSARALAELPRVHEIRAPTRGEVIRVPEGRKPVGDRFQAVIQLELGEVAATRDMSILAKWASFVASLGGEADISDVDEIDGLAFVATRLDPRRLDDTLNFNPLRAIRPQPVIRPLPVPAALRATGSLNLPPSGPSASGPQSDQRVAVFDAGTGLSPIVAPFVILTDVTTAPSVPMGIAHGSMVTSAVLFGPVSSGARLAVPPAAVDHYRIVPAARNPDPDERWMLRQIRRIVGSGTHRLVNLSLGPDLTDLDAEPHLWTSTLDRLARDHDVVFVVAVGNHDAGTSANGSHRIQVPADMVNGLSVGACTSPTPETPWGRARYSRVGPGRAGARTKPTGVSFGGELPHRPFIGLGQAGELLEGEGTSYAAPLVTHGLAQLLASGLGSARAVNTLRAFAVHFADYPDGDHRIEDVGYGRIRTTYDDVLMCGADEVTLLYEDRIAREELIALPLPIPGGLPPGLVTVRWTLAIAPEIDAADAVDYTRQTMEIVFRPDERKVQVFDSSGRLIRRAAGDLGSIAATAIAGGGRVSSKPVAKSPGRASSPMSEVEMRESGKWETLVRAQRRFRSSSLHRPRLDLAYLARDGSLRKGKTVPDLDYSLLVTIIGPRGSQLYQRVRQTFPVLTPLRVETRVRAGA